VLSQLFGKDTIVGIDVGSSCIKAVEIEAAGSGWRLVNAALQPTPPDCCRDGTITDTAEVAQAIKMLLRSAGIRASGGVTAISGSQVIVRQVQMAKMNETALRKSIRYEASRYISSSMEDSVVEFEIIGNVPDSDLMNVMLVAAPRELVESRVGALEAAGIEPISVDVEAFALMRSLVEVGNLDAYAGRTVALVDMGASHTDVNIISNGEFALTRSIPIAGQSFTNAIKTLQGISNEDAERLKYEMTSEDSIDRLTSSDGDTRCWRVVQPLLDELLREIRRSMHYYQSQFPEGQDTTAVSQIILSGGASRMPGMAAYMDSKLNVPTKMGNPFSEGQLQHGHFTPDFINEYGPVLAVCAGLALKEEMTRTKQPVAA
jgi:type IV pilus assembly protein PilM